MDHEEEARRKRETAAQVCRSGGGYPTGQITESPLAGGLRATAGGSTEGQDQAKMAQPNMRSGLLAHLRAARFRVADLEEALTLLTPQYEENRRLDDILRRLGYYGS